MNEPNLRKLCADLSIPIVHKNGRGWVVARCPFAPFQHEFGTDGNPSFFIRINPTGYSGFNCYSCHDKGNLHKLITRLAYYRDEDYDHLVIRTLRKEIPDRFDQWEEDRGAAMESMDPLDVELYYRMYPTAWDDKGSRAYLKGRGISKDASHVMQLRFDPDNKRIMFPIRDFEGNLYGFSGRTILPVNDRRPKVRDYAGLRKERCLLGEELIDPDKPMLLVEGLFAYARMVSIGAREFCNPVASMGSVLSAAQANILSDFAQPVYLLYDLDFAGDQGILGTWDKKAGKFIGGGALDKLRLHVPTLICEYPKHAKDPDHFTLDDLHYAMAKAYSDPEI